MDVTAPLPTPDASTRYRDGLREDEEITTNITSLEHRRNMAKLTVCHKA